MRHLSVAWDRRRGIPDGSWGRLSRWVDSPRTDQHTCGGGNEIPTPRPGLRNRFVDGTAFEDSYVRWQDECSQDRTPQAAQLSV